VPGEVSATPAPARLRISPAARRRALELGVAVAELRGSGPHGAIVLRDVDGAARLRGAAPVGQPAPPASARAQPAPAAAVPQRGAASPALRAAIAAAMSRSKRQIPHYYLSHTFSMMRCRDWLATENARRPVDERLLPGALLLKAVAVATWEVPEMNGFWQEDRFVPGESVHLGVAISLRGGGVIAPAILDADDKPVEQLMAELRDLVARTRARSLRSSELAAPTITVTSLGDRSPEAVWGVIYPPQVAIVGFGGICERPWVEDGSVVCHPVLTATLSADHRASDGHRGGLFLMAIERLLQEPGKL
jgi:pyruvate dehydrogenase E2 component (dihydrolipoamide acetyltransferase)